MDLDDDGVTLEVQACVEVAGKRFQAEPQTVKQGFHGELAAPNLKLSEPLDGQVVIEERKIACKVYRLETVTAGENGHESLLLDGRATVHPQAGGRHYGPGRQERAERDGCRGDALDMRCGSRGETAAGATQTVHKNAKGAVTTLAVVCGRAGRSRQPQFQRVDKSGRVNPPQHARIAGCERRAGPTVHPQASPAAQPAAA